MSAPVLTLVVLGPTAVVVATRREPTLKRAHLHRGLHEEAARRGLSFEFGKRLVGAELAASGVRAHFEDRSLRT
jgi:hypothetical protein